MNGWNHRVFRSKIPDGEGGTMDWFTIREAYYDENDKVNGWTGDPLEISGENVAELRQTLEWMIACLDKEVVDEYEPKQSL